MPDGWLPVSRGCTVMQAAPCFGVVALCFFPATPLQTHLPVPSYPQLLNHPSHHSYPLLAPHTLHLPLPPGQLDHTAKELLDELAALMAAQIDTFDARGLANVVWAWGKIRYLPTPAALTAATQAAISKIGEFGAQHLANVLWACVYLHHRNTELLRLAAEQVGGGCGWGGGCQFAG